jgi:hypothetical protein
MTDLSLRGTLTNPSLRDGELLVLAPTWSELTTPPSLAGMLIVLSSRASLPEFTALLAGWSAGELFLGVLAIAPLREVGMTSLLPGTARVLGVLTIGLSLPGPTGTNPLVRVTLVLAIVFPSRLAMGSIRTTLCRLMSLK